jgi:hypothetical protein
MFGENLECATVAAHVITQNRQKGHAYVVRNDIFGARKCRWLQVNARLL